MQTLSELRSLFLDFFHKRDHQIVKSSSLIPANDPTLMFTAAGMVQFKDAFLGKEVRSYSKAVSSQKCVRAGGKHNDLENVGHTARHLTFFEMLGNFSFQDYFKEQAIKHAWDFVTNELKLDKNRLYITVYHTDNESCQIWKKVAGFEDSRIIKIANSDNFWTMGDTGPCGPCSEIFYDQGEHLYGGLPGTEDQDGDRYIEIWNLVFMEYEQLADGKKIPLVKKSVDTGMGLERTAAILQKVHSNFDIDLFRTIINAIENFTSTQANGNSAYRVVADHLRSCSFLIADGVMPSNEGRGYVLRRILRRAVRYINQIGYKDTLLYKLLPTLVGEMGNCYPELIAQEKFIGDILRKEEEMFLTTLDRGLKLLNSEKKLLQTGKMFPGETAFKLHDTYGFPVDLTQDILKDNQIKVDVERFNELMQEQKERAKKSWVGSGEKSVQDLWFEIKNKCDGSEFIGYDTINAKGKVLSLVQDGEEIEIISNDREFYLVTNQTPFYGESGGQMGDIGIMKLEGGSEIEVLDTQKPLPQFHVHLCKFNSPASVKIGDVVKLIVDKEHRNGVKRNHTATHLLHAALKAKLGAHIVQKGSLVAQDRLRFDFSHNEAISREVLDKIENDINNIIYQDLVVTTKLMKYDNAIQEGAVALFGEKYEDEVRVVSILDIEIAHSIELCGGTHVERLGEIGMFKILHESSIASGIRRIEAVTAKEALTCFQDRYNTIKRLSTDLHTAEDKIISKVTEILDSKKTLEKELDKLKQANLLNLLANVHKQQIGKAEFIFDIFDNLDLGGLRKISQQYVNSNSNAILVAASILEADKIGIVCAVGKNMQECIGANNILDIIAKDIEVKGGGNNFIAQAMGINNMPALKKAKEQIIKTLNQKHI